MGDIIYQDNTKCVVRFQCCCLDPVHALDVWIERDEKGITINIGFCEMHWSDRDKAFGTKISKLKKVLKGENFWNHDFNLRLEDLQEFINLLNSSKVFDIIDKLAEIGEKQDKDFNES